ncbi:YqiJ family protein [uncultured Desulfuromonas sp.]|uniref:YqiJ family protein n=1 Tax=uncultured Desulfuromonas sp. TaxID=181013 RepID=UPI002AAC48D3|nr:YqiJ family protein [uncultured Desulfuromonas sp.]
MMVFISSSPNLPFSIALAVLLLIALLEGVGMLFGLGLSTLFEGLIPDIDLDFEADLPDNTSPFALSRLLGWLRFGEVPALMLLVIFLTAFGLIGLAGQMIVHKSFGAFLPASLASVLSMTASLPLVRVLGGGLAKILPKDETSAVSDQSFIGRVAVITLGTARQGAAAEGKLVDKYGQTHYLMIEPDVVDDAFPQGEQVLVVSKREGVFRAIRNVNQSLVD